MTKELLFRNLDECLADVDRTFTKDDLDFIVEVGYHEMRNWTYRNFKDFANDINGEWGDYLYILREYDLLPDLIEDRSLVNDWFSDHEQAMRDCLAYNDSLDDESDLSGDELYDLFDSLDSDLVVDWLTDDHEQAYFDCMRYVLQHKGN